MTEYFKCHACGQVVQGWNASQSIACCPKQQMEALEPDWEPAEALIAGMRKTLRQGADALADWMLENDNDLSRNQHIELTLIVARLIKAAEAPEPAPGEH